MKIGNEKHETRTIRNNYTVGNHHFESRMCIIIIGNNHSRKRSFPEVNSSSVRKCQTQWNISFGRKWKCMDRTM